jgi:hypothetical protein
MLSSLHYWLRDHFAHAQWWRLMLAPCEARTNRQILDAELSDTDFSEAIHARTNLIHCEHVFWAKLERYRSTTWGFDERGEELRSMRLMRLRAQFLKMCEEDA